MLVPCTTGRTNSDLVCANCSVQSCANGFYVADACNGTADTDNAKCMPCSCPAEGYWMPNNQSKCNASNPTFDNCVPCTQDSTCRPGFYLAGKCSTYSNPTCQPCRSQCGLAEVEATACTSTTDRKCLPNPGCYQVLTKSQIDILTT